MVSSFFMADYQAVRRFAMEDKGDIKLKKEEKMKESCEQCKYFEFDDFSVCRRYPPVHTEELEGDNIFSFPNVGAWMWCGEFKPKEERKRK